MAAACRDGWLDTDPVGLVHPFPNRSDREVAALLAASLSLGRVASIRISVGDLFGRLGPDPARVLAQETVPQLRKRFAGFRHRFFGADDVATLAVNIGRWMREAGSLAAAWPADMEFEAAADAFARAMSRPVPGLRPCSRLPLVVSPAGASTCKRLAMFLRWVARPADGVDLGLWTRPRPDQLVVPLDVHVFRIARLLGLTRRKTANWEAAREVTASLARLDPVDPVRYDFALSRIGIVHGCRGRWMTTICPECPVRDACRAGRAGMSGRARRPAGTSAARTGRIPGEKRR